MTKEPSPTDEDRFEESIATDTQPPTRSSKALDVTIRQAKPEDDGDVRAMTESLWTDRGGDYLPDHYHEFIAADADEDALPTKTFVAEKDDVVVGIVQAVQCSPTEAWFQGMRVHPDYRRQGISSTLNDVAFDWARTRGCGVGRVMIYDWNDRSLGAARACGFEPVTGCRFAHPEPVEHPKTDESLTSQWSVSKSVADAWTYWRQSEGCTQLHGLGLTPESRWMLRRMTRTDFDRFDDETSVIAITGPDGQYAVTCRTTTETRAVSDSPADTDQDRTDIVETTAIYGLATWKTTDAAGILFNAISRDAASVDADRIRVLIPETVQSVSDVAAVGTSLAEDPFYVLAIDLTSE